MTPDPSTPILMLAGPPHLCEQAAAATASKQKALEKQGPELLVRQRPALYLAHSVWARTLQGLHLCGQPGCEGWEVRGQAVGGMGGPGGQGRDSPGSPFPRVDSSGSLRGCRAAVGTRGQWVPSVRSAGVTGVSAQPGVKVKGHGRKSQEQGYAWGADSTRDGDSMRGHIRLWTGVRGQGLGSCRASHRFCVHGIVFYHLQEDLGYKQREEGLGAAGGNPSSTAMPALLLSPPVMPLLYITKPLFTLQSPIYLGLPCQPHQTPSSLSAAPRTSSRLVSETA